MARQKTINSEFFSLDEFTQSATAKRCGINNEPSPAVIANLQYGVSMILDPLRRYLGEPVIITSGYRCRELNEVVRGVPNSWHCLGNAADIHVSGKEDAAKKFAYLKQCASVDTVLFEHSANSQWLHVQWDVSKTPRHQANFNYIAKLIILLFVLFSSASCRSSKPFVQQISQKDSISTLHQEEKSVSFFVVRDSAFADLLPLLVTPFPADADSGTIEKLRKNTVLCGRTDSRSKTILQQSTQRDSTNITPQVNKCKNIKSAKIDVWKVCRFGIFCIFLIAFICLVVRFRKKNDK